ncbi:helix-turn-helix transcriptional regulator [Vibrio litoralis]|uniref:helix-turn-helix transcriptional regulator n=1 Tax=Vibrio litoralis TaxID=335972 RepID=UPI00041C5349|nr:helix-turn-helix transcriptional regulator [Vibrio litoralis]
MKFNPHSGYGRLYKLLNETNGPVTRDQIIEKCFIPVGSVRYSIMRLREHGLTIHVERSNQPNIGGAKYTLDPKDKNKYNFEPPRSSSPLHFVRKANVIMPQSTWFGLHQQIGA